VAGRTRVGMSLWGREEAVRREINGRRLANLSSVVRILWRR
jgi:hypothetical protein